MEPKISARILHRIANQIDRSKNPDRKKVSVDLQELHDSMLGKTSSSYLDSAKGQAITKDRALKELGDHGVPENEVKEFFKEVGDQEEYDAQEVLRWLGY